MKKTRTKQKVTVALWLTAMSPAFYALAFNPSTFWQGIVFSCVQLLAVGIVLAATVVLWEYELL